MSTVRWAESMPQAGTDAREDARVAAALKEAKIVHPAELVTRITHPYAAQVKVLDPSIGNITNPSPAAATLDIGAFRGVVLLR